MTNQFVLDPFVEGFNEQAYNNPLTQDIWKKYFWPKSDEKAPDDVYARVAVAISNSPVEKRPEEARQAFFDLMKARLFLPGGRILAGAGTDKRVTLMNCYVNCTLEDSMEGIMEGVSNLALTSQQGGGMGTSFETLRPVNALLSRTQSAASGPLPFMDVFNQTGKTIRSAGERRAAQMGTMSDTHPDLPAFIVAKGEGLKDGTGRFKEFNVSVLVSDAFKAAVEEDAEWLLYFHIAPISRPDGLEAQDFVDDDGVKQYVYSVWRARELWDLITKYTYEFNDPGVIFIDRINDLNNLSYCEEIRCTNPCGEQPLPPHGTCNLGAINVANLVQNPFSKRASINYDLLGVVAAWGVRFLDNVIDVTSYPLPEQQEEEFNKRRIGLGILGLGTLFASLGVRYGSVQSVQIAERIMRCIALAAYDESIRLAEERGSFPMYDDAILDCGFVANQLDDARRDRIKEIGLRNGVILTIAPTGTGSIAFGDISSGCECDFAHEYERSVRSKNTEVFDKYIQKSYTKRFYEFVTGNNDIPDYMVTSQELEIEDHLRVQGALQKWVDASISKTINIPVDYPFEKFKEVYDLAYMYGCKGCTTYRYNELQGSILKTIDGKPKDMNGGHKRPEVLVGNTYKVKWPSLSASIFITVNYDDQGKPYEIFFASKDAKFQDWVSGITLMMSAMLRNGIDPGIIPRELKSVVSTHDFGWVNGKHYGSLVARIGAIIEEDFKRHGIIEGDASPSPINQVIDAAPQPQLKRLGDICPACSAPTLIYQEGCKKCLSCTYSAC